jgi:hypothetical protein
MLYQEKLEDIKEAIRSCKSKMDRKYNSKKNDSITNNDLQNTTQQLKVEQHEPHLKQEFLSGFL